MAALTRAAWLLRAATRYALAAAEPAVSSLLARPTPCAGWDLELLLRHLGDSMAVLSEAMAAGSVSPGPRPSDEPAWDEPPGDDPVKGLHRHASGLLAACVGAGTDERLVAVGDRHLTASMTALSGALEITVHGWDIAAACGSYPSVPAGLAAVLLPVAPLLVTPALRPGLFADPVRVPVLCDPGDQLVAFLGRQPLRPGAPSAA
jgi:uncharacterized protein (TIGR03086 family)